jgi:hypothetical protein
MMARNDTSPRKRSSSRSCGPLSPRPFLSSVSLFVTLQRPLLERKATEPIASAPVCKWGMGVSHFIPWYRMFHIALLRPSPIRSLRRPTAAGYHFKLRFQCGAAKCPTAGTVYGRCNDASALLHVVSGPCKHSINPDTGAEYMYGKSDKSVVSEALASTHSASAARGLLAVGKAAQLNTGKHYRLFGAHSILIPFRLYLWERTFCGPFVSNYYSKHL